MRGTLDKALDVLRQNVAMGWAMITMVEGISRAEGGIGAMILNQNKHFARRGLRASCFVILALGLLMDYGMGVLVRILCPYARSSSRAMTARWRATPASVLSRRCARTCRCVCSAGTLILRRASASTCTIASARHRHRPDRGAARPVGRRQDAPAPHHRRARPARLGHAARARRARRSSPARWAWCSRTIRCCAIAPSFDNLDRRRQGQRARRQGGRSKRAARAARALRARRSRQASIRRSSRADSGSASPSRSSSCAPSSSC